MALKKKQNIIVDEFYDLTDLDLQVQKEEPDVNFENEYDKGDDGGYIEVKASDEELPPLPNQEQIIVQENELYDNLNQDGELFAEEFGNDLFGQLDQEEERESTQQIDEQNPQKEEPLPEIPIVTQDHIYDNAQNQEEEQFGFDEEEEQNPETQDQQEEILNLFNENDFTLKTTEDNPNEAQQNQQQTTSPPPQKTKTTKPTTQDEKDLNTALKGIALTSPARQAFLDAITKEENTLDFYRQAVANYQKDGVNGVKSGQDTLCDNFIAILDTALQSENVQQGDVTLICGSFQLACQENRDNPCLELAEIQRVSTFLENVKATESQSTASMACQAKSSELLANFQQKIIEGYAATPNQAQETTEIQQQQEKQQQNQEDNASALKRFSTNAAQIAMVASIFSTGGIGIAIAAAFAVGFYLYNSKKLGKENKEEEKERLRQEIMAEMGENQPLKDSFAEMTGALSKPAINVEPQQEQDPQNLATTQQLLDDLNESQKQLESANQDLNQISKEPIQVQEGQENAKNPTPPKEEVIAKKEEPASQNQEQQETPAPNQEQQQEPLVQDQEQEQEEPLLEPPKQGQNQQNEGKLEEITTQNQLNKTWVQKVGGKKPELPQRNLVNINKQQINTR